VLHLGPGPGGEVVRRAGVMAVVLAGGEVRAGDAVSVQLPRGPHLPLEPVRAGSDRAQALPIPRARAAATTTSTTVSSGNAVPSTTRW
jgi:MOSC domain-containing protein YiiM